MPAKRAEFKSKAQAASRSRVGAAKVKDKAKEQKELGYKTAVSLIAEIILPDGVTPPKKSVLLPDIEDYPGFIKITKSGQTYYPSKEALTKTITANLDSAVTFCYITLQTDVSKAFDVDHVCPRDYFVKKQKLLLDYLNKNHDFAKGFLGEENLGSEYQKKISHYFVRDKTIGEIKATKWFCDSCYNSISNLSYLLHYINREKGAIPPSRWLERDEINEEFKADLLAQGGIIEGVIMQGVITGAKDRMQQLVLKGARSAENITIYLHEGTYQGLGDYIRSWFLINKAKTIQASRGIGGIKTALNEILVDEFHGRIIKKAVKLEKILVLINGIFSATKKFSSLMGSSGSDSSIAKEGHKTTWEIQATKALQYMSTLKRLKKMISGSIAADYKEAFNEEFYNLFFEKGFLDLPSSALDEACRTVEQTFGEDSKENLKEIGRDGFIDFVDKLIDKIDPVKQAFRERSLREAAEHKAEVAEKKLAQLEALLASRGVGISGGAQTADVAMATPISATAVQRPIRRAAKLATLPQQQAIGTTPIGELQKRGRQRDDSMDSSPKAAAVVAMAPAKKRQSPATRM